MNSTMTRQGIGNLRSVEQILQGCPMPQTGNRACGADMAIVGMGGLTRLLGSWLLENDSGASQWNYATMTRCSRAVLWLYLEGFLAPCYRPLEPRVLNS